LGGALGSCSSLNSLCFSGCEFGDDKIEKFAESFASSRYLARGVSLSVMYFAECSLTDASLPSIEKLMLCGIRSSVSKDTSEGVSEGVSEDIADDVSEIASLSLRSNVLSIASATRICSICSPKMTRVNLSQNKIYGCAARKVRKIFHKKGCPKDGIEV
ncbi:hypothetical protein ADUPG1_009411, partial [Aduncisulcus paluster]